MNVLINHFNGCQSFTIDTESDHCAYEIALIEGHSIRARLPSFILFTELNHIPPSSFILFQGLFELGNTITSWESPRSELGKALNYQPFPFPLALEFINVQLKCKSSMEDQLLHSEIILI
jgi:hypothetical protein